jgi:DNA-directed RNA polymerase I, II, and III subunit RPABC2
MSYFDNEDKDYDSDENKKHLSDDDDDDDDASVHEDEDDDEPNDEIDEDVVAEEPFEDDDVPDEDENEANIGSQDEDDEDDNNEDGDEEEEKQTSKKTKKIPTKTIYKKPSDLLESDDESDDDDTGGQYLQKFDQSINDNYILNFHPESILQNYDEILTMTKVVRNAEGVIVDKLHRTIPYLTKYEKARILGQRAKQINSGAQPFIAVPENVIDGYLIAEMELKQKKIPFIIRRPMPNRGSEYWKLQDLEDISF